jgi:hypothetical protein
MTPAKTTNAQANHATAKTDNQSSLAASATVRFSQWEVVTKKRTHAASAVRIE